MSTNEEDILASINKLRLSAFELIEKAKRLRKDSEDFTLDRKVEAMRQIVEWTAEAENLNIRASELALQMIDDTKEPVNYKPSSFMGSFLFIFALHFLCFLLFIGNESSVIVETAYQELI